MNNTNYKFLLAQKNKKRGRKMDEKQLIEKVSKVTELLKECNHAERRRILKMIEILFEAYCG